MVLTFIMKSSHPLLMFRFITNRYFCYILVVRLKKKNFGNKPFPSYSKIQMVGDLYIFCYFFFLQKCRRCTFYGKFLYLFIFFKDIANCLLMFLRQNLILSKTLLLSGTHCLCLNNRRLGLIISQTPANSSSLRFYIQVK